MTGWIRTSLRTDLRGELNVLVGGLLWYIVSSFSIRMSLSNEDYC